MAYYPSQFQTWTRASTNDGLSFQSEFSQIYSNFAYILATSLANAVVGNATGNIPLSNGTACVNLNASLLSGATLSIDGAYTSDSDTLIPSQKATKTYVASQISSSVGKIYTGIENSAPANVLLFNGAAKSRASFSALWTYIQANFVIVTDAVWLGGECGKFSSGDGSTTFRMPDWQGLFLRGAGTNTVFNHADGSTKFEGGTLLSILIDQMFPHYHNNTFSTNIVAGGSAGVAIVGSNTTTGGVTAAISDGVHGINQNDGETAPVRVAVNYGVYYA